MQRSAFMVSSRFEYTKQRASAVIGSELNVVIAPAVPSRNGCY